MLRPVPTALLLVLLGFASVAQAQVPTFTREVFIPEEQVRGAGAEISIVNAFPHGQAELLEFGALYYWYESVLTFVTWGTVTGGTFRILTPEKSDIGLHQYTMVYSNWGHPWIPAGDTHVLEFGLQGTTTRALLFLTVHVVSSACATSYQQLGAPTLTYEPVPDGTPCGTPNLCGQASTCQAGVCIGSTVPKASGTLCRAAACTGAGGVPGASCDGVQLSCPAAPAPSSCGPYSCAGSACGTSCATNADCAAGAGCRNGSCQVLKLQGAACAADGECANGRCVDGYCCDARCTGQCEACDVAASQGTCTPITGAPHGARTQCASDGSSCGGTCDGSKPDACAYPGSECRAAGCEAATGTATLAARCASGSCPAPQTIACAPYVCGPSACLGDCRSSLDCVPGSFCAAGLCIPKLVAGAPCAEGGQCGSGFCVDGVCCESACQGQCEACAEAGHEGACLAVSGAPRAGRAACAGTGACAASCDGSGRDGCVLPGAERTCAPASCESGTAVAASTCDGAGACREAARTSCGAYACAADACRTDCDADADCAPGILCRNRACVDPTLVDAGGPQPTATGCGCASVSPPAHLLALLGLALLRRRRTHPVLARG